MVTGLSRTAIVPQTTSITCSPISSTMDMSPSSNDTSAMEVMMTPWLHFVGGDNLYFKKLHPSSVGAIVGACIVLVLVAIFERWVSGMRGSLETYWRQKTFVLMASRSKPPQNTMSESASLTMGDKSTEDIAEVDVVSISKPTGSDIAVARTPRVLPPFVAAHDVPRGFAYALQALLAYLLMLAVMTFQAAYFISIVVGLGIGEMLFGRMGNAHLH